MKELKDVIKKDENFQVVQTIVNYASTHEITIYRDNFTFSDLDRDFSVYTNYRATLSKSKTRLEMLDGSINGLLGRSPTGMYEFIEVIFLCQEAVEAKKTLASIRADALGRQGATPPAGILPSYNREGSIRESNFQPRKLSFGSDSENEQPEQPQRSSEQNGAARKRKLNPSSNS